MAQTILPKTILVVEDEPAILRLITLNFELEGFDVMTATQYGEAMAVLADNSVNAIVCDVMLPGPDGFAILKSARALVADIPFVFVSARALPGDAEAGLAAGANAYITKPFDPQELIEVVRSVML